jgi:hypothetical protein
VFYERGYEHFNFVKFGEFLRYVSVSSACQQNLLGAVVESDVHFALIEVCVDRYSYDRYAV